MKESSVSPAPRVPSPAAPAPGQYQGLPSAFIWAALGLVVCFGFHVYQLVRFALDSELFSYVLLVPFVSGYLLVTGAKGAVLSPRASPLLGISLAVVAIGLIAGYWLAVFSGTKLAAQDATSITTLSLVFAVAAAAAFLLPTSQLRRAVFPLVFLLFTAPFPIALEQGIETFLQHGSAPPSYLLFKLAGTPVFKQDMVFQLPGMTLQIAPECSGIRSTLVLFMTSLVAGHLFLRSPWKRTILVVAVVPLALVRNGFRIFTIGELCVHVGPHMIDSAIHHRGGPIFFALSLIPFSALVYYLVKSDRKAPAVPAKPTAI